MQQMYSCTRPECDMHRIPTPDFGTHPIIGKACAHCGGVLKVLKRYASVDEFKPDVEGLTQRELAAYRLGLLDFVLWAIDDDEVSRPPELVVKALEGERTLRVKQLQPASNEGEITEADLAAADHELELESLAREIRRGGTDA